MEEFEGDASLDFGLFFFFFLGVLVSSSSPSVGSIEVESSSLLGGPDKMLESLLPAIA